MYASQRSSLTTLPERAASKRSSGGLACRALARAAVLAVLIHTAIASADESPPASGAARIPFTVTRGNIVVTVELVAGHPLPFIFDSGLSVGNILTEETARKLNLASKGQAHFTDSSGNSGSARVAVIPSIRVGDSVLMDQKFAITHVPDELTRRKGKAPIAGFIGAPLMEGDILCLDFRHHILRRWLPSAFNDAGLASMPMRFNHGLPTIDVAIDGLPATLIVDSGDNGGLELFPAFADENDLRDRLPNLVLREGIAGSGNTFDVYSGSADTVELAPHATLRQVPLSLVAQAMDPQWGIDGLAGFKFLSRLNPCLDSGGQRLLWSMSDTRQD